MILDWCIFMLEKCIQIIKWCLSYYNITISITKRIKDKQIIYITLQFTLVEEAEGLSLSKQYLVEG